MPKYFISHETGTVYWLDGQSIIFSPLCLNGTFDTEEGGEVDEILMQGELTADGKPFEELYAEIRKVLTAKAN